MARFALVLGNTVATIVEQASLPTVNLGGTWVDVTGQSVGAGYTYNGSAFTPPKVRVSLSPREFWRRFTSAERETLEDLAMTGTAAVKKKLAAFKTYIATGGNVELDDDYVIATVTAMEGANVIAAGRAAVILAIA